MERAPEIHKQESLESTSIDQLESVTNRLEVHVQKLQEAGSTIDPSEQTIERVTKKVSKLRSILNAASVCMALLTAYEVGSYTTSRYEITSKIVSDGKTKYEHEDPETTRIMEFLTGAEELPVGDRIYFYQQVVRDANKHLMIVNNEAQGIDTKNAFEKRLPSNEQDLREVLRDIYTKYDVWYELLHGETRGNIETRIDEAFAKSIKPPTEYDPAIEKILWDTQKAVGAPRIRWSAPEANTHSQVMGKMAGPGRANYEHSSNTVYITPGSDNETLGKNLFSEDAHALQFNNYPIQSRARYILDMSRTAISSVRQHKSMYAAQQDEYTTLGTIEYEAHKVIEPQLIEKAIKEAKKLASK